MSDWTDPWECFLSLSEWDDPSIGAETIAGWPEPALPYFEQQQLLRLGSPDAAFSCPDCRELHDVVWIEHPLTGATIRYARCPEVGPYDVSRERLRRWCIEWDALVAFVASQLQLRGVADELVAGRLWQLGRVYPSGRPATVFLGRALHRRDTPDLLQRIDHFTNALLLVPRRRPTAPCRHPVLSLDLICDWTGRALQFDRDFVAAQLPPAESSAKPRRPKKEGHRAAVRQRLRAELENHIAAARNQVQSDLDFGREPKLLPFPSYDELARRCGTSKATISRCVAEDRALKAMIEAGRNLFRLMGPRSSVPSVSEESIS